MMRDPPMVAVNSALLDGFTGREMARGSDAQVSMWRCLRTRPFPSVKHVAQPTLRGEGLGP